ncbi:MAG: ferrous iron transport protein A [Firmicutes bacterium]|nr:ferrous iron transport protein A [Bacillota bacterium]
MPLTLADKDKDHIIKRIGGNAEVKSHLEDLGFVVGAVVRVISTAGGNLIVIIKDTRIALDRELAQKITV